MMADGKGKTGRYTLCCVLWILTVLICLRGSLCGEPEAAGGQDKSGEAVEGLQVFVTRANAKYQPGKPNIVTWSIVNVGKEDRQIIWHREGVLGLYYSPVHFEIGLKESGKRYLRSDRRRSAHLAMRRRPERPDVLVLLPGETKTAEFDLSNFFWEGAKPGIYEVSGVYAPEQKGTTGLLGKPEYRDVVKSRIISKRVELEIMPDAAEIFGGTTRIELRRRDKPAVFTADKAEIDPLVDTIRLELSAPCTCVHKGANVIFTTPKGAIRASLCEHCFIFGGKCYRTPAAFYKLFRAKVGPPGDPEPYAAKWRVVSPNGPARDAAKRLGLVAPVDVPGVSFYSDGGTVGIGLVDANGKAYPFCLDGRMEQPHPRHVFTGADHPSRPGAKDEPIAGETERALTVLLKDWVNRQADDEKQKELLKRRSVQGLSRADLNLLRVLRVVRRLSTRAGRADAEWGEAVDGLQVSITPAKAKFRPREPKMVTWSIRNIGKEDRKIVWHELHYSPVFFEIGLKGGKKLLRGDSRRRDIDRRPAPPEGIVLNPGDTKTVEFDLSDFAWGQPKPGLYEITGVYYPQGAEPAKRFRAPPEYTQKPEFKDAVLSRINSKTVEIEILPAEAAEALLTLENLHRIKRFILTRGDRAFYCSMFNNNPHFAFRKAHCYLDPDTGQQNINCELGKSDFNRLVIRTNDAYYRVRPSDGKTVQLLVSKSVGRGPDPSEEVARKETEVLFREFLAEIAAAPAELPWGEAVEGVQVRLRADKVRWKVGETPTLKAEIRNQGARQLSVIRASMAAELEIDGRWCAQREIGAPSSPFPPGRHYKDIGFTLDKRWWRKKGDKALELLAGKRTVRVAFTCNSYVPPGVIWDGPVRMVRVVSNPVEIEILPAAVTPPAAQKAEQSWITFAGRVVDDETGGAVERFSLQTGWPSRDDPGRIVWTSNMRSGRWRDGKFNLKKGCPKGQKRTLRVIADGYVPQPVMPEPLAAPAEAKELLVRLTHGLTIRGRVLDHKGKPVKGAGIFLGGNQQISLDETLRGLVAQPAATSDADGRFAVRGLARGKNVVIVAEPLFCVWRGEVAEDGQVVTINLPEPASLLLQYDIPGDADPGRFRIELKTWDDPLLKGLASVVYARQLENGGELALKLAPGVYDLSRTKNLRVGNRGHRAMCDRRLDVTLQAGKVTTVASIRKRGRPVAGEIVGLKDLGVPGAFIRVQPAEATGDPYSRDEWKLRTFDAVTCDVDGTFRTARIPPGRYKLIAEAYKPAAWRGGEMLPDFLGAAEVTVPADVPPAPVRIRMNARPPRPRAQVGEAPWGESVQGVQARLRVDKVQWKAGETLTLKAEIRNQGTRQLSVIRASAAAELEIDGRWHAQREIRARSSPFPPGRHYKDIDFALDKRWWTKKGDEALTLGVGKRTVRVAFTAQPTNKDAGRPIRVVSNPVEIEIVPHEEESDAEYYRRQYATYKSLIMDVVKARDKERLLKITDKFNDSIDGGLLFVKVVRVLPRNRYDLLIAKSFTKNVIPLAKVHYRPSDEVHVRASKDSVQVENSNARDGTYMDNVIITLLFKPRRGTPFAWGKAVEGVQVRLRADKLQWKAGETIWLDADIRNQGKRELVTDQLGEYGELEIDGKWYKEVGHYAASIGPKTLVLKPGDHSEGIRFLFNRNWLAQVEGKSRRLQLATGKHVVRVALTAEPREKNGGEPVRAVSNPVKIEILPTERKATRTGTEQTLKQPTPKPVPKPVMETTARAPVRRANNPAEMTRLDRSGKKLFHMGHFRKALVSFRKAHALGSRDYYWHYDFYGWTCWRLGLYDEMADVWGQTLRLKPDSAFPPLWTGWGCLGAGRLVEAKGLFELSIDGNDGYGVPFGGLGWVAYERGSYAQAAAQFSEALARGPSFVSAVFGSGMAHRQLGHTREATRFLQRALWLEPDHAGARYEMGLMCVERGDLAEARQHCRVLVDLDVGLAAKLMRRIAKEQP